jgi:hypothetical protein
LAVAGTTATTVSASSPASRTAQILLIVRPPS